MRRFGKWLGLAAAGGIIAALVPVVRGKVSLESPLRRLERNVAEMPKLDGLDLMRLDLRPQRVMAPLSEGRQAQLTLDPVIQRAARAQMQKFRIPESGVVMLEVKTGRVLAYASYVNANDKFDVNARAEAPAASVFKVVTSAALIERAGLNAETEQCYHGGKSRISPDELIDDPVRDKWCATMAMALGRSLNVVFARLAQKHLTPEDVSTMGGAFGFGAPLPFAVANEAPQINIPEDPLEFARSSAGFWNTTLSPLAAAELAQTVANGGAALEPRIVSAVFKGQDELWKDDRPPRVLRRAVKSETAAELTKMMRETVENGSAFKSFHDERGTPYLPGIQVAGKTGTLTRYKDNRYYTWFIGFAPADKPEVAISALVVNNPSWQIKAAMLAREVLRAYFAEHGAKGVTPPS
ncbi:MAG TPA: penicillin-binding transpeptidase domain-containing protein [Polyangiaceae bacterium]|jgi:peptidoglycan glycosyltransferase|nr:penicillin-binding transpeptidase domain-containing protein [Polyangiaceae bacterium]